MNYLILLKKYMQHIVDCEGTSFVEHTNAGAGRDIEFTEEEVEELERLDKEIRDEY